MATPTDAPLPIVDDLRMDCIFPGTVVHALRGLSDAVGSRAAAGPVGESASGQSVSALVSLGLPLNSAWISSDSLMHGRELAMVVPDPLSSPEARTTVRQQIAESLQAHRAKAPARTAELLGADGMAAPECRMKSYPHQSSGGVHQRLILAIGISYELRPLIADEPTTALSRAGKARPLKAHTHDHRTSQRVIKGGRVIRAGAPHAAGKGG